MSRDDIILSTVRDELIKIKKRTDELFESTEFYEELIILEGRINGVFIGIEPFKKRKRAIQPLLDIYVEAIETMERIDSKNSFNLESRERVKEAFRLLIAV